MTGEFLKLIINNNKKKRVTELLGFLPQELERHSLIKFIHPDDLDKMKQIHYDSKFLH